MVELFFEIPRDRLVDIGNDLDDVLLLMDNGGLIGDIGDIGCASCMGWFENISDTCYVSIDLIIEGRQFSVKDDYSS